MLSYRVTLAVPSQLAVFMFWLQLIVAVTSAPGEESTYTRLAYRPTQRTRYDV